MKLFGHIASLSVIFGVSVGGLRAGTGPAWWESRGVVDPNAAASDFSLINQGQLKQLATQAFHEMEARLSGGAGATIRGLVSNWATPPAQPEHYATVNTGQLKNVARVFFDRLAEVGYVDSPVVFGRKYPWTPTGADDADFTYANIGQAKQLFSFDFAADTDGDGMPNWWEQSRGLATTNAADASADADGDGLTNREEFLAGRDPNRFDENVAGQTLLPNPEELFVGLDPSVTAVTTVKLFNRSAASTTYTIDETAIAETYHWSSSDHSGGPAYVWNDIAGTGTRMNDVSGVDDATQEISDIGFSFPFFGDQYSSVWVSSNGYITLGTFGSTAYANNSLPNSSLPHLLIAPFFDDLETGDVYYRLETGKLTIQFSQATPLNATGDYTFQVVLEQNGTIMFYYKTMVGGVNSATIGIQNDSVPLRGSQVGFNGTGLPIHGSLAVTVRPWLDASPKTGTIAAGGTADVSLTMIAQDSTAVRRVSLPLKDGSGQVIGAPIKVALAVPADSDGDGISDQDEPNYGTDPFNKDSNGDGILDWQNVLLGLSSTNLDLDGDGLSNWQEVANGTNPFSADSDGDGVNDRLDPLPLDSSVSSAGGAVAGAPVITRITPPAP